MMGSDMGQQQQVVYDSTGGGGYGQQQPQQQYMGMQQYGGYPQQVATVQLPQQQYGGMVQQATGYGMPHDMYCKGRVLCAEWLKLQTLISVSHRVFLLWDVLVVYTCIL